MCSDQQGSRAKRRGGKDGHPPFFVDLLHADIQGEELRVLRHAQETLDRKVGRLITATHSRGIHRELRAMLVHSGWEPAFDFGFRKRERSAYGDVQFLDGLLAFVNPRL